MTEWSKQQAISDGSLQEVYAHLDGYAIRIFKPFVYTEIIEWINEHFGEDNKMWIDHTGWRPNAGDDPEMWDLTNHMYARRYSKARLNGHTDFIFSNIDEAMAFKLRWE